jgi:hypothetical protein
MGRGLTRLEELERRRIVDCRLAPEHALATLDDAEAFLVDRGLLTLMPDCSLPSLFGACHEEPYRPGGRGFAGWPKTKWWWGGALAARPGIFSIPLHAGKGLFLTETTAALADPLCRAALADADEGADGPAVQRLVRHLAEAGPAAIDELKEELGLGAKELRALRARLERVGALIAMDLRVETEGGGHRHTSELYRWDQVFPTAPAAAGGLEELLVAGVEAAVLAPEREARSWFSWRAAPATIEALVEEGRIARPGPGLLSAAETASWPEPATPAPSPRRA